LAGAVSAISKAPVFVHFLDKRKALARSEKISQENEAIYTGFFEQAGCPPEVVQEASTAILRRFRKLFSPLTEVRMLEGGEVFSFDHFKLRVLHTPGHTAGSISLFDDANGVLLSGDCLIENVVPYTAVELASSENSPHYYGAEQYDTSLELLRSLPVQSVLPGHRKPFSGHREVIEQVKHDRSQRREKILELLAAQKRQNGDTPGISLYEATRQLLPNASGGGMLFVSLSDIHGYLELMEKEGLVTTTCNDGKWRYALF
jgi:glyoxylase-like metal-dependent hydrolase (beta-lactamase superfamily II)